MGVLVWVGGCECACVGGCEWVGACVGGGGWVGACACMYVHTCVYA